MRTVGSSDSAHWSDHLGDNTVQRQTGGTGLQLLHTGMVEIVAHVHTETAAEPAEAHYTSGSMDTECIVALFAGLGKNQAGVVVRRPATVANVAAALADIRGPDVGDFIEGICGCWSEASLPAPSLETWPKS